MDNLNQKRRMPAVIPGGGWKAAVAHPVESHYPGYYIERIIAWAEDIDPLDNDNDPQETPWLSPLVIEQWGGGVSYARPSNRVIALWHESDPAPTGEELAKRLAEFYREEKAARAFREQQKKALRRCVGLSDSAPSGGAP